MMEDHHIILYMHAVLMTMEDIITLTIRSFVVVVLIFYYNIYSHNHQKVRSCSHRTGSIGRVSNYAGVEEYPSTPCLWRPLRSSSKEDTGTLVYVLFAFLQFFRLCLVHTPSQ